MSDACNSPLDFPNMVIRSGRNCLVVRGDSVVVNGEEFPLEAVDRVLYCATPRGRRTRYRMGVAVAGRRTVLTFDGSEQGAEGQEEDACWQWIVGHLNAAVCGRIAASAARTVREGGTVSFGGPSAVRIAADPRGLRQRLLPGRTVPWARIRNAQFGPGTVEVLAAGDDGVGSVMRAGLGGWNAVVLPGFIRAFQERDARRGS